MSEGQPVPPLDINQLPIVIQDSPRNGRTPPPEIQRFDEQGNNVDPELYEGNHKAALKPISLKKEDYSMKFDRPKSPSFLKSPERGENNKEKFGCITL